MAFKPYYETEDKAKAAFGEGNYVERDGKFWIDVEQAEVDGKVYAFQDISGLKNTVSTLRTEIDGFKKKMKSYDGIEDPQAALDALAKLAELGDLDKLEDKAKIQARIDAVTGDLKKKHGDELSRAQARGDKFLKQLKKVLVDGAVDKALGDAQVKRPRVLRPHVKARVQIVETDDGDLVARVMKPDGSGEQISMKSDSDGPMGVDELVSTFSTDPDFKDQFPGVDSKGIGVKPADRGGGGSQDDKTTDDPVERLKAARAAQA